jgi:DNA-directed RNA polymerase specialized sigma subunit
MTHEEIAQRLGLTRAAVSEAERTALAKLKRILHARGFTMEDFFGRDLGE